MLLIIIMAMAIGATDGSWGNHSRAERSDPKGERHRDPAPPVIKDTYRNPFKPGDAYYEYPQPTQQCNPCGTPKDINTDE